MNRWRSIVAVVVALVFAFGAQQTADAAYESYCGTATKYWSAGGYQFKLVYQGQATPVAIPGATIFYLYDRYQASQMSGWWKIANDEHHACGRV